MPGTDEEQLLEEGVWRRAGLGLGLALARRACLRGLILRRLNTNTKD